MDSYNVSACTPKSSGDGIVNTNSASTTRQNQVISYNSENTNVKNPDSSKRLQKFVILMVVTEPLVSFLGLPLTLYLLVLIGTQF